MLMPDFTGKTNYAKVEDCLMKNKTQFLLPGVLLLTLVSQPVNAQQETHSGVSSYPYPAVAQHRSTQPGRYAPAHTLRASSASKEHQPVASPLPPVSSRAMSYVLPPTGTGSVELNVVDENQLEQARMYEEQTDQQPPSPPAGADQQRQAVWDALTPEAKAAIGSPAGLQ
jgi:hypothetical protein